MGQVPGAFALSPAFHQMDTAEEDAEDDLGRAIPEHVIAQLDEHLHLSAPVTSARAGPPTTTGRCIPRTGGRPPGSTLPVEPELCETFGVSRITVRVAVGSLEAKGLVRARQGSGTTVTQPEEWNLLDPVALAATVQHDDALVVLDQLVAVRSALEAQMAAQAVELATAEDLQAIERMLSRLDEEETTTPARFIETDVAFHDRIMQASRNRLGRSIIRTVHAQARTTLLYTGAPDTTGPYRRPRADKVGGVRTCRRRIGRAVATNLLTKFI